MLDDEKDLFLKRVLQKDKIISKQANEVFKNFYKMDKTNLRDDAKLENTNLRKIENTHNGTSKTSKISEKIEITENEDQNKIKDINRIESKDGKKSIEQNTNKTYRSPFSLKKLTAIAASVIVASSIGVGSALLTSGRSNKYMTDNSEPSQISSINIINGSNAADYITAEVKNEEVEVEEEFELKVSENEYARAVLTSKGDVVIQIKNDFKDAYKLKIDTNKMYKVSDISETIADIFVGSVNTAENVVLFLLTDKGYVHCVQLNYGATTLNESNKYELCFFDQGKIDGLRNVTGFEEKQEQNVLSDEPFYYINAIFSNGSKKLINDLYDVDMNEYTTQSIVFSSQDGQRRYSVNAKAADYKIASGWEDASNNVYYINDGCLYHLSRSDGTTIKLVTGVKSIENDEEERIIVNLKEPNKVVIHKLDSHIILNDYEISDSKIIDKQEDENVVATLRKDGSISIELKTGAKERLGASEKILENYRYNLWAIGHCNQVNDNYNEPKTYANATSIYLGRLACNHDLTLTYSTTERKCVSIDLKKVIKDEEDFYITNNDYILTDGLYPNSIVKIEPTVQSLVLSDGTSKDCYGADVIYANGEKVYIPISSILNNEGYSEYSIEEKEDSDSEDDTVVEDDATAEENQVN